jgi:hypothetical protein
MENLEQIIKTAQSNLSERGIESEIRYVPPFKDGDGYGLIIDISNPTDGTGLVMRSRGVTQQEAIQNGAVQLIEFFISLATGDLKLPLKDTEVARVSGWTKDGKINPERIQ